MSKETISTSIDAARRLAVTRQHLAGELPAGSKGEAILSVVRDLGYVQWDPINVVAPSHIVALWNRIGNFRLSDLERLLWDEKKLKELENGPLRLGQFEDHVGKRSEDGWSSGSDVSTMLFHLQMTGDVMIVGHQGNQNLWGLSEE